MKKLCFKCGEVKLMKDFYKHKKMADGHLNKCKVCTKKDVTTNRYRNHEHYLSYDKKRFRDSAERKKTHLEASEKYRKKSKVQIAARGKLRRQVLKGNIAVQPCSVCGIVENVEAHHKDYSRPLDVVWLCSQHHGELHRTSPYAPS